MHVATNTLTATVAASSVRLGQMFLYAKYQWYALLLVEDTSDMQFIFWYKMTPTFFTSLLTETVAYLT